jgi:hypothetical protein
VGLVQFLRRPAEQLLRQRRVVRLGKHPLLPGEQEQTDAAVQMLGVGVFAVLGNLHQPGMAVDEMLIRRACGLLGIGNEALEVPLRFGEPFEPQQQFRQISSNHDLVGVGLDVVEHVWHGTGFVATLHA